MKKRVYICSHSGKDDVLRSYWERVSECGSHTMFICQRMTYLIPFIAENIDEVTRNMRTKGVLKLITPYTRFTLAFIAKQLKISTAEVQDIVGFLIVDRKLKGKINQENGTVEVERTADVDRTHSMQQWSLALDSLWHTVLNEGDGFKVDESQSIGPTTSSFIQGMTAEGSAPQVGSHAQGVPGKRKGGGGKKMAAPGPRMPLGVK